MLHDALGENGLDDERKVRALRLLATAGDETGKLEVAEGALRQLAETFEGKSPLDEAATRDHLAEVLQSQRRPAEAAEQLVRSAELHVALASQDASSDHWLQAADRYQQAGNIHRKLLNTGPAIQYLTQAKEYLHAANALDAHPRILYDLARAYIDDGGVDRATLAADCLARYRATITPASRHTAEFRKVVELEMQANQQAGRPNVAGSLRPLLDPPTPAATTPTAQDPAASRPSMRNKLWRSLEDLPSTTHKPRSPTNWTRSRTPPHPASPASPSHRDDNDPGGRPAGGMRTI